MRCKLRYTVIPACISFGPLFMVMDMSSETLTVYLMRLAGAVLLSLGLGLMLSVIANQQRIITELLENHRKTKAT